MSTVATTPRASTQVRRLALSTDSIIGVGLAIALCIVTFVTVGGVDLGPNTWTEIVLTLVGATGAVAVLLIGARGRAWGGVTLLLFLGLTVLSAASIGWSVRPDVSWIEAGRTLSYLAVFAAAAACARLFPGRWAGVLGALAVLTSVACSYALLVKVFPATLDPGETFSRLRAPYDYWNATGLIAAMGLPPLLWTGARTDRGRALRALSAPGLTVLVAVVVLSYSRGAVLAAVIGLGLWFTFVPLRLRGALVFILGAAGGAVVSLYALHTHPLSANLVPLPDRTTAGHGFGVLIVLVLLVMTAVGFVAAFTMDRFELAEPERRRIGTALLVVVALLPLAGIGGLAASSRGLTGEVSHIWNSLTGSAGTTATGADRLVQLDNSRGRYWREGITIFKDAPVKGVGAGGYGSAVTRFTHDAHTVGHAHSYVIETLADFGLIGVALMVAMLSSWILAVRRTLWEPAGGLIRSASPERVGLLTMLATVVTFGVHSTVDWTWFVPGTAIPALLCAGWLVGRGPISTSVGTRPRTRISAAPGSAAAVLGVAMLAVLCAWAVWQPLHATNTGNDALTAAASGHMQTAIADARAAADENPVAVDPLFDLGAFYHSVGDDGSARSTYLSAISRQPQNFETWLQYAQFELRTGHPEQAVAPALKAERLNLTSLPAHLAAKQARRQTAGGGP